MVLAPLGWEFGLGDAFGKDFFSALVGHRDMNDDPAMLLVAGGNEAGTGQLVARQHHAGEPTLKALEVRAIAQPVGDELVGERHRQHAVRDDPGQSGRPGKGVVEVNRIAIPRRRRVLLDLLHRDPLVEWRQALAWPDFGEVPRRQHGLHGLRMMNRALASETSSLRSSFDSSSKVTSSMSPRGLMAVIRPV